MAAGSYRITPNPSPSTSMYNSRQNSAIVREPKVPVMQGARSTNLPTKYSFHKRLCTQTDTEQSGRCKQGCKNAKAENTEPWWTEVSLRRVPGTRSP